ncbi:hypothetical protein P9223_02370 [Geobacillus stearothermophilus]|nr:hypothetical protein [Geobacillus stearothermophilus]MED4332530.1 hypothetical protein [Geobacillus stearothermophilus]MED4995427.1 hypothetical protein [Geobacillus stearothermophilus]
MNQKIEGILPEVKASLSFEGLQITEEEEKLIKAALSGDISRATFLKKRLLNEMKKAIRAF